MTSEALTSGGVSKTHLASPEEVEAFLQTTSFSGYQSVPLPHGFRVPGDDRAASVEAVFGHGIAGCSVLDVGTYYGRFLYEAKARGAGRVVGVEADPARSSIARRIARLHGHPYDVVQGRIEDVELNGPFDLVLVLNVLHHVPDPVAVMRRVASLCRGEVIVEFPMADHHGYISNMLSGDGSPGLWQRAVSRAYYTALRVAGRRLPLMAVGGDGYHRTFYFNPGAFLNLFTIHHPFFDEILFRASPDWPGRCLARCRVRATSPTSATDLLT
jgi:SAM-dependent methyltransferase